MAFTIVGTSPFALQASAGTKATKTATKKTASKAKATATKAKATKAAPPPKLAKPQGLKAYAGYKAVKLEWKKVKGADRYIIMRSVAGKKKFRQVGVSKKTTFTDKIKKPYTDYAYRVYAARPYKGKLIKSAPAKKRENSVRRLRIYVTLKAKKKIKGKTIKKGTTIMTEAYGGGYYVFYRDGKAYSVPRVKIKDPHAKYDSGLEYTRKEVSFFVTDYLHRKKLKPTTKYVIWVSTYTQHAYALKKKNGQWVAVRDWDVSTGRAATPTSTGNKKIKRKVFSHHGINFWNCFSDWNALHGISGNMGASLGRLASHGCVRNGNKDAAWIYANCAIGTRIIIY